MNDILLNNQTDKIQIMEFMVGSNYYAINVKNLKSIIQIGNVVVLSQSTPEM